MAGTDHGKASRGPAPKVHVQKVADLVAEQLRWRILTGELADGDELPRESDLIEEYGVSRPSLREALRILETEGLVRIRRGKIGGGVLRRPTPASAAYHLGLTLRANDVTVKDLAIARVSIEPACAALAADLPDRQAIVGELTVLIDASEQTETGVEFAEVTNEFHMRLTELCGNTTMVVLAGTLEAVWSAQVSRATRSADHLGDPASRRRAIAAHRRIVSAIEAGNRDRSNREMRRHLTDMQQFLVGARGASVIELALPPHARYLRMASDPSNPKT
jgi:DNA-binding FadR family transcriptional regulator